MFVFLLISVDADHSHFRDNLYLSWRGLLEPRNIRETCIVEDLKINKNSTRIYVFMIFLFYFRFINQKTVYHTSKFVERWMIYIWVSIFQTYFLPVVVSPIKKTLWNKSSLCLYFIWCWNRCFCCKANLSELLPENDKKSIACTQVCFAYICLLEMSWCDSTCKLMDVQKVFFLLWRFTCKCKPTKNLLLPLNQPL